MISLSRFVRLTQCQQRQKINVNVISFCSTLNNHDFRVSMENNENHNGTMNDQHFKYKTQGEHFLSTKQTSERSTSSYVENIQVLPPSKLVGSVKVSGKTAEMSSDRVGQWPTESESEMSGAGLDRLRNGRYNKVS